ncbi:hypothetical protein DL96DRAFT_654208 [Flagelloscypha sp. PMI_526]|nr:hypothetical protein DL96DRAFT_654208 [Flagelloscypha sp. PMI_526]
MDLNSDGQACEKESSISGSNDQSGDAGSQPHGDLLHSKTATSTDDVVALPSSKDSGHAALQNHLAGPSPSTPASAYTESPASEYFDCIPHPPPPPHNIGMPARAFHHDPANAIVFNSPSKEIVGTPFSDLTTDGIHTRFEYPFPSPAVGVVTDAPSPALTTASTTSSTSSLHSPLAGVPSLFLLQSSRILSSQISTFCPRASRDAPIFYPIASSPAQESTRTSA